VATDVLVGRESRNPFLRLRAGLGGEMLAEFFGTFILIALGDGAVAVSVAGPPGSGRQTLHLAPFGPANWLIIAWGWAFAVTFGLYVAGGAVGIAAYDFFVGEVLRSRGKMPESPPLQPGQADVPAARSARSASQHQAAGTRGRGDGSRASPGLALCGQL